MVGSADRHAFCFDNQSGEIERVDAAEGFTGRVVDGDAKLISVEDLPL